MGGRHAATTAAPHRDFKERSVVLAVAHPNPSLVVCLFLSPFAESLADSRCNLHATSRSSHSRRSPSYRFLLCRVPRVVDCTTWKPVLLMYRLHRLHRFWARSARRHLSSGQEVTRGRCHPCRFCPVRCHEGHARVSAAQAANSWSWALPPRRSATWMEQGSRVAAGCHLHDLASQRLASTQERVGSSTASGDVDRTPPRARVRERDF